MTIASLTDLVKLHEGLRLRVYDDASAQPIRPGLTIKGHPTIGYGRALDLDGISGDEAEAMLARDLEVATHQASGTIGDDVWPSLNEPRQAAIIDMAFTMGTSHFASYRKFISAVRAADWPAARDEIKNSKWYGEATARAEMAMAMMFSGAWPA